ncbi:MAG: DNA primase [bacterium]|nr:DNA primase [bacterium]
MGDNVAAIKERLDIAEVLTPYLKLEKSGANYKARCPFHTEKTPSFYVSTSRQSYYCFGCGAKGDIFTFVQEMEGLDFRESLKHLAEKAGVELALEGGYNRHKEERDKLYAVLEEAASFFERGLAESKEAKDYIASRGVSEETIHEWRLGFVRDEWRLLYTHLTSLGFPKSDILKVGLAKTAEGKEDKGPYDVFRGRIIFPLFDSSGRVVAFSGRALAKDAQAKYLNSPDTSLWTKGELLYGLNKAKEDIRKKNYAVLVEGQIDLILSHQAGVHNTVASSGTAFTEVHLERLGKLSRRIVLAFDGDEAGENASMKSTILGLSLGMEVKIASLPQGSDPAAVIEKKPESWKDILRDSLPAIEHLLLKIMSAEKDDRKRGKLIEKKILPLIALLGSAIERSHFVSLVAKKTGIREEMIWEDLRRSFGETGNSRAYPAYGGTPTPNGIAGRAVSTSFKQRIEERLAEIRLWKKDFEPGAEEMKLLLKEELELESNLSRESLREELGRLRSELFQAESLKDDALVLRLSKEIQGLIGKVRALEGERKML